MSFTYGGTVTNNQMLANTNDGIDISSANSAMLTTVSNNTITANGGCGITNGDTTALITGNTVSGQTNVGQYGIQGDGQVQNNVVFNNYVGVYANGGTWTGNRVYDNKNEGILFSNGTTVSGNDVYSNGTYGIQGGNNGGATTISNNLIYANGSGGFDTTSPGSLLSDQQHHLPTHRRQALP